MTPRATYKANLEKGESSLHSKALLAMVFTSGNIPSVPLKAGYMERLWKNLNGRANESSLKRSRLREDIHAKLKEGWSLGKCMREVENPVAPAQEVSLYPKNRKTIQSNGMKVPSRSALKSTVLKQSNKSNIQASDKLSFYLTRMSVYGSSDKENASTSSNSRTVEVKSPKRKFEELYHFKISNVSLKKSRIKPFKL